MKFFRIIPTCCALGCSMALMAQTSSATLWSYADCVNYAREHNIELQQSVLSGESTAYSLESAKGQWQPSLDFSTTQGYSNQPWAKGTKNAYTSNYGLNASWTVWDGGSRSASIKRASTEVERSQYATDNIRRNIETEILSLYINILYSTEAIELNRSAAAVSKAQAERAAQMEATGRTSKVDLAQLQAQAEQDAYSVVSSEASRASQIQQLKKLLELRYDNDIDIQTVQFSDDEVTAPLPDIAESYSMAVATDAQLKYNQLSTEVADQDIAIAKSSRYPQIALSAGVGTGYYTTNSGGWGEQMKQAFNENVGVSVTVPIFDRKKTSTAVAQARISKLNSQLDIEARETEISQTLEGWYTDMQSAQTRFKAAGQQVEAAELSNDLITKRFELGYVEVTEMLQGHNTLTAARHEQLQAKYMAVLARKMVEYLRTQQVTL